MIGSLVAVSILIAFIAVAGAVVIFFVRKDQKFTTASIFSLYFYVVAIISLLVAFFGATTITKAVASDIFGRDFSYYNYAKSQPHLYDIELRTPDAEETKEGLQEAIQRESERIEGTYQDDLFTGSSALVVGLIFLAVHMYGWRKLEPATVRTESIFYKGYIMLQLAVFSIITLISLPVGISQGLRYAFGQNQNVTDAPGEPLSFALWSTPIWLVFIYLTIKAMRHDEPVAKKRA